MAHRVDGTAVPPTIGEPGRVMRPVRRGYLVLWPCALAAAIAYGMAASALAVPLAQREAGSDAIAGRGADCHVDAATETAEAPSSDGDRRSRPRTPRPG